MMKRSTDLHLDANHHLSDASLMLTIDGELSDADYLVAKEHLRACWSCRARKEQMARAIEAVVEYEHVLVAPDVEMLSSSGNNRAVFRARLDELALELGKPSWMRRCLFVLSRRFTTTFVIRTAWVAALALGVIAYLSVGTKQGIAVVSAAELLQRAVASEPTSVAGINRPIPIQKLSIAVNGRTITRTIYHDSQLGRYGHEASAISAEEHSVRSELDRSSFGWDDPLSPHAYRDWWQRVDKKQDSVTKLNGNLIRLDTVASSGPIAEGSLTVRATDYHPVAEELVLPDKTHIEITEISYGVVDLSSLSPDIFGETMPVRVRPMVASIHPHLPDQAQLADAELRVLMALHEIGADLGESITIQQTSDLRVKVDGVTESEARRQQIAAAVAGIDFIEFRVRSAQQANAIPEEAATMPDQMIVATTNPPLLEQQLKQKFPDVDQRTEFINRTISLCEGLSARSWALKRLADRYPPQHTALLDLEAQAQLQRLLNDQRIALNEEANRMHDELLPVLDSTVADGPVQSENASSATMVPEQSDDWRNRVDRIHRSAQAASDTAMKLFAQPSQESVPAVELQQRFRVSFARMQVDLQMLDLQLHQHL